MATSIKAESRDGLTKSGVKELRASGKVPGVVYGKEVGARQIAVGAKELLMLLRANPHAIVEMELPGGGKQPVMIHEVQRDQISRSLLHIDFHQIDMSEPVRTSISLEFSGEPQGAKEGGILQIQLHEVEVRCLPADIKDFIAVDVSGMEIGDTILVRDITAPSGVEIKSHGEDVVATLLAVQREAHEPDEESQTAAKDAKADQAAKDAHTVS